MRDSKRVSRKQYMKKKRERERKKEDEDDRKSEKR